MEYQGAWNATTNSPELKDGTGSPGDVYRVSVAGSHNFGSGAISFEVGDYAIYNGSAWEKSDTTDSVASVAGKTGAVTLAKADITDLTNVDNTSDATKNSATSTLTNKRVTPRVLSIESSAEPELNTDEYDQLHIKAQAVAITSMTGKLSGTPTSGQKLVIRILDNGTARAITWGASFVSRGATLPTTTVLSKIVYVGCLWNATASKWDCVAVSQEV